METTKTPSAKVKQLLDIAARVRDNKPISPVEADLLSAFEVPEKESKLHKILATIALPGSIILGMSMAGFPAFYENLVSHLPACTNMSEGLAAGVDYIWSIIGEPIEKNNIIYHIPNVILYSFGVIGIKKVVEYIRKKTWLDKVNDAKVILQERITKGIVNYNLKEGHSLLFVGNGDFIAEQFGKNCDPEDSIILATHTQHYTSHWLYYNPSSTFNSLQNTLDLADAYNCGEYVMFPIIDTEIFLPGPGQYDLSPEKVEVVIQAIRDIEKIKGWPAKRIIIVGDKKQTSCIQTENIKGVLDGTIELVSLESVQKRFEKIIVIDATDLVIETILKKFPDRRIFFRSSVDGGAAYKTRFYERLKEFGYIDDPENKYTVVVGYDLYDEQVERESLATNLQEYLPVVLSHEVHDALIRNEYHSDDFIYVPDLVLNKLKEMSSDM